MIKKKRIFGRTLRWTVAIVVALMFHLALFWGVFWSRDSGQHLKRSSRQFTKIQYFDAKARERSEILDQQMTLFDPRPMLLPTEWNASTAERRQTIQGEEGIFADFDPMFEIEDGDYLDDFGNVAASYDQLSIAQVDFDFSLFNQIGRAEFVAEYRQNPGLEFSIQDPKTGEFLKSATIYNSEVEQLNLKWPEWAPTMLLATVNDGFNVAGFSVMQSSGHDEVDQILVRQARVIFAELGRIKDGNYLLEIIP